MKLHNVFSSPLIIIKLFVSFILYFSSNYCIRIIVQEIPKINIVITFFRVKVINFFV